MNYQAQRPPRRWKKATAALIQFGPFAGFNGEIVSVVSERVTVRIILERGCPILVELDADMIGYDDTLNAAPKSSVRGVSV